MNNADDETRAVRVEGEEDIFNDFFRIKAATVQVKRSRGGWTEPRRMLSFERGDAVAAVMLDRDRDKVVLIRQFRYPTAANGHGWVDELVAGMLPKHETPEQAMRREIFEETGYEAGLVTPLTTFYVSPGGSSERILLFYAEIDLDIRPGPGGGLPHTGEEIELLTLDRATAFEQVRDGRIVDAKTIIGLQWLMLSKL